MTGVPPQVGSGQSGSAPSPDGLGHTATVPNAAFVAAEDVRVGQKLVADSGFSCLLAGEGVVVGEDSDGLYVPCADGRHYLDGQLADGRYVGLYPLAREITPAMIAAGVRTMATLGLGAEDSICEDAAYRIYQTMEYARVSRAAWQPSVEQMQAEAGHEVGAGEMSSCPHAVPFIYCQACKAEPCPVGLGDKTGIAQ